MSEHPTIFLPGIKGSKLIDTYPLEFESRWSLEDLTIGNVWEDEDDLALTDGLYDPGPRMLRDHEIFALAYRQFVGRLRHWVSRHVYVFSYDWRLPLETTSAKLTDFVDRVRGKFSPETRVNFVTHSMGGLIVRSYLWRMMQTGRLDEIGQLVFIAPPFKGSLNAVEVLIKGEKQGLFGSAKGFRKIARGFQSVYQLLPSYPGAVYNKDTSGGMDIFEVQDWQENVLEPGKGFRADFLHVAEAFHQGGSGTHGGASPAPMITDEDLKEKLGARSLVLISTGHKTMQRIPVEPNEAHQNRNWYNFKAAKTDKNGDGVVSVHSAAVDGIPLGIFEGAPGHAFVCREEEVANTTSDWLKEGQALRPTPRTRRTAIERRPARTFPPWDPEKRSSGHTVKVV
jgi:pimeloyl-ACP methyl ester carboxylesterase